MFHPGLFQLFRKVSVFAVILVSLLYALEVSAANETAVSSTQRTEILNLISKLEARIKELQKAGVTVESSVSARIDSVSNSAYPLIKGRAKETKTVELAVFDARGQVYGIGDIAVTNGSWSHKMIKTLPKGEYTAVVYVNKIERQRFTFPLSFPVAKLGVALNGKAILTSEDVSEQEARKKCLNTYSSDNKFGFKAGDTLTCSWDGKIFRSVNE